MVKPWETTTIGDFLDFKNGLNKGKEFFGYGTPIVNYTDVYKNRGLRKADIRGKVCLTPDEIHRFDVRKNDVFFTRTSETPDEVGMSSVLLEDIENGVFSGFVLRGRPKNDMFVPEYCKYCFSTEAVRNAIITGCTYTTRALTNGKQLSAIELPIPSKPEQEAIAEALSDIDTLIVNLEKLIAKKKAIKQGAMQELLTGKRRLPGFDGEWKSVKLGDYCTVLRGGSPRPIQAYLTSSSQGANWIKIGDVREGDKYITSTAERIIEAGICKSREVFVGDFILSNSMSFGRPYILKIDGCIHDGWLVIQNYQESFDQQYLYYVLGSDFVKAQYIAMAAGSSVQNLNKEKVSNVTLYKPDIEEQQNIASILSDMDEEISGYEAKLAKYIGIKQGMMSELLTGRIRLIDKEDA